MGAQSNILAPRLDLRLITHEINEGCDSATSDTTSSALNIIRYTIYNQLEKFLDNFINFRANCTHHPPLSFSFSFWFSIFILFFFNFFYFFLFFPYFHFSLFHFFSLFLFQSCGLPGILKLRSVTFLLTKIDSLYLEFALIRKRLRRIRKSQIVKFLPK